VVLPPGRAAALAGASHAMLKVMGWPFTAVVVAWLVLHAAGQAVLATIAGAVLLFLLSLVLHELGHVVVFRVVAPRAPGIFTARTGRFRLIRGTLPTGRDIAVTLAGPAAPFLLPALLAAPPFGAPVQFWAAAAIAFGHVSLLLRRDGDGAMLRAAVGRPTVP
jgi:hypothetical protein